MHNWTKLMTVLADETRALVARSIDAHARADRARTDGELARANARIEQLEARLDALECERGLRRVA
jgi:hypothetical protein